METITPTEAVARIRRYLGGPDPQGHKLATEALLVIERFIAGEPEDVDRERLAYLLAHGTQYKVGDEVKAEGDWEPREDWGGWRLEGWGQIADALRWECGSCRPDVGWPKWDTAIKAFDTKVITIHVECGHCGNTYLYNELGDEIEEQ